MSIMQMLLASVSAAAAAVDSYFPYVTMLLHAEGTNGATNSTFIDGSTNNFSLTRNGNATQGSFSPYGSNWSMYNNGTSGNLLSVANNTALQLGSTYTAEAWVYALAYGGNLRVWTDGSTNVNNVDLYVTSGGVLGLSGGAATVSGYTLPLNTWVHIAVVVNAGALSVYIDGTSRTLSGTTTGYNSNATTTRYIGAYSSVGYEWNGYISNVRFTKGGALYTSTFTPSTTPLTTTVSAGTVSLLMCQSNRFIDTSVNAFTVTIGGSPSIQRFCPFTFSTAYSTATNGGSMYFDGSGDNVQAGASANLVLNGGAFTIEAWIYNTNASASNAEIVSQDNGSSTGQTFQFRIGTGLKLDFIYFTSSARSSAVTITSTGTIPTNAWTHVAVSWGGAGTGVKIFINGTLDTTSGNVASMYAPASIATAIGSQILASPAAGYFTGYITDVRLIKGSQQYTATFTPPTAPLTAITNTQLLVNSTNGGIVDNAMINDLETINTTLSSTQAKFGSTSMSFNGSSTYINFWCW